MLAETVSLETFRKAINSNSTTAVLCGAGISMIVPTRLPSGNELRDMCVTALLSDPVSKEYVEKILQVPAYRMLLPERALQEIAATAGVELDIFMSRILDAALPNPVHEHLAQHYRDIFTTNFDLCLEHAGAPNVSHLHGTIAAPETLQNRIFRLGKTSQEEFDRFRLIRGRPLLVLGYSCRDRDIVDLITETGPSIIFYLSYDGSLPATLSETSVPCLLTQGSAEDLFEIQPTRMLRCVGTPRKPRIRKPSRPARANALMRLSFSIGQYDLGEEITRRYLPLLRGRARLKMLAELGNVYRIVRNFDRSEELAREILADPSVKRRSNADLRSTARVHLGLLGLDQELGNHEDIERNFLAALEDIREFSLTPRGKKWTTEISIWTARIYNNLGILYSEWGRYNKAVKFYHRSCRIKQRHHEEVGIANTLNNLAKLYIRVGAYDRAFDALDAVLATMQRLPDSYVIGDVLDSIPSFLQRFVGVSLDPETGKVSATAAIQPELARAQWKAIYDIANVVKKVATLRAQIR